MKKTVYLTSHHWDTKRQGGFHKFAEFTADNGIKTVFFSFPRPYYGYFMQREQLNPVLLKLLNKGATYKTEKGSELVNVTFSTLRLPDGITRFLPDFFANWLLTHSIKSFRRFDKKFFKDADCFVFESCEGVALLKKIRKLHPESKVVYRPSDPMVYASIPERVKKLELAMLKDADLVLLVNDKGLEAYKKEIPDFENSVNYEILSNGVDIESYLKTYEKPEALKKENTMLYVGAWEVEWNLIFECADKHTEYNFIIVCPNVPEKGILSQLANHKNVNYIPGIKPAEVPAYITNCSVVIVPYVTDFYRDRPLGITAKYYQAMAAGKPIVAYHDTQLLKDAGAEVTYSYEDFEKALEKALKNPSPEYSFNLKDRTWEKICAKFLEQIKNL